MNKREMVRSRIEEASRGINNAVCWDDPEWNDENGKSIMDRLVEDIDRIYGVREDDDVEITGTWLRENGGHRPMASVGDEVYVFGKWSNGFYPVQCQKIRASRQAVNDDNWLVTAFDREVELTTRLQFRRLCEALGIELKETV